MRDIRVSDITMREAAASKALSLSFKEKLEIVKILDRIGVGSIEVEGIEPFQRPGSYGDEVNIREVSDIDEIPLATDGPVATGEDDERDW